MKVCNSTWSLHREIPEPMGLLEFPAWNASIGIHAIEIVESHLPSLERGFLDELRAKCDDAGVTVAAIAANNDFTVTDRGEWERQVERVAMMLRDVAGRLGATALRVNTGRADEGDKAPERVMEAAGRLVEAAARAKVAMAVENHGGISSDPETVLRIVRAVGSPWFGTCPDFGNFPEQTRYECVAKVAPYAKHVHAKAYEFDNRGEETRLDYARLLRILRSADYDGYLSIEFEGPGDQREGTKKTLALIQRYL